MNHLFITCMAIVGLVATSACSRSSEGSGGSGHPHNQNQQTTPAVPNAPPELDAKSGKSSIDDKGPQVPAPVRIVHGSGPQTSDAHDPSSGQSSGQASGPQTAPSQNQPAQSSGPQNQTAPQGPQVVTYDPTGLTPSQIFEGSAKQSPSIVGNPSDVANGQSGDVLNYSSSGQDSLREQLQEFVDSKTTRVVSDKEFAKRVSNGRFTVDWSTRTAVLDVTIKSSQGPVNYRFAGALDNRLLLRGGDLRHGNQLSVEAACMDLNGGCNTVYAKVQSGTGGVVRTAHMLIRQTEATLFTQADGFGEARNAEFDHLLRTLVRTVDHSGERESVNALTLRTSETINGQSSFKVEFGIISGRGYQETLNIGGPLVKPADDFEMNASAQLLPSTSPIADTIRSVSLVRNDGRGDLMLAITVRKATAEASEDTANVTIARIHKPARVLIVK